MTTTENKRRYNSKCWRCGVRASFLSDAVNRVSYVCACGTRIYPAAVRGTVAIEVACGKHCTEATGHECRCSCGGKMHGSEV